MILVAHEKGSIELLPLLSSLGLPCERSLLPAADFAFTGNGPQGLMDIGIERKRLHDMLACIEDGRFNAQRGRMRTLYRVSILILEGHFRRHDSKDLLMEGFPKRDGSIAWGYCRPRGSLVGYSKLRRYLCSVSLAGVHCCPTETPLGTAHEIHEWYHYFQKKWNQHTSLQQMQKVHIPTLNLTPSLTRKWANAIDEIGVVKSEWADRIFKTPIALAEADDSEWQRLPGIGPKTARRIVQQIQGRRS